jgi:hypothetical protein
MVGHATVEGRQLASLEAKVMRNNSQSIRAEIYVHDQLWRYFIFATDSFSAVQGFVADRLVQLITEGGSAWALQEATGADQRNHRGDFEESWQGPSIISPN